jgi:dTMP kinase
MSSPGRGLFVVIEGIDGSGSTTQAQRLVASLVAAGRAAVHTCEPSAGPVGKLIRSALERRLTDASGAPHALTPDSLALLFAADRLDHVRHEVEPALARGEIVVTDRYVLSSLAYQSATSPEGEGALPWLRELNRLAPAPDVTIVIDVSAETAARRRAARGGPPELFETTELQERLAALYRRAGELLPGQAVQSVDGEMDVPSVSRAVWELLAATLRNGSGT